MAACYEKLKNFDEMVEAAKNCIKADKKFVKGYFRLAVAHKNLSDLPNTIKALESGLAIDASNKDLKGMKKEIVELQRAEQVAAYYTTASQQHKANDIGGAYKTLELARRLDAGNADVEKLWKIVEPAYAKQEQARKKNLSPTEQLKEQGDELYKAANFEGAIEKYTKCLDKLEKTNQQSSELALKAYANRAACFKQISNHDACIADCTAVLEVDPENIKALIRRAQAFEGVERYRFALQDIKTVLRLPFHKVGKSNFDLANGMQHRLQRTVDQLKKMSAN